MAKFQQESNLEEQTNAILNRANVHLAAQRRLADSWFSSTSPSTNFSSNPTHVSTSSNSLHNQSPITSQAEEEPLLEARSDRLGLGAVPVKAWKDGKGSLSQGADLTELEALRKQVLRKKRGEANSAAAANAQKRPRIGVRNGAESETSDSESEGGRAAAVGRKARVKRLDGGKSGHVALDARQEAGGRNGRGGHASEQQAKHGNGDHRDTIAQGSNSERKSSSIPSITQENWAFPARSVPTSHPDPQHLSSDHAMASASEADAVGEGDEYAKQLEDEDTSHDAPSNRHETRKKRKKRNKERRKAKKLKELNAQS